MLVTFTPYRDQASRKSQALISRIPELVLPHFFLLTQVAKDNVV